MSLGAFVGRLPDLNTEGKAGTGEICLEAGVVLSPALGLGPGSVILFLALWVGDGTRMGGDLEAVTEALLGNVTEPPRENDLKEDVTTLGTVGTELTGSLGVTGRSGTAATGCSSLTEDTGSEGTAATGSGRMFCTGEMRARERGVSCKLPLCASSGSSLALLTRKMLGSRGNRATVSRPSV